jgi:transcriptional regulator GlxA family with amidase domain
VAASKDWTVAKSSTAHADGYVQFQSVSSTETARHASALRVAELAACVQMSSPTFHHHFRQLAAMSPLQYQKWLRLMTAQAVKAVQFLRSIRE